MWITIALVSAISDAAKSILIKHTTTRYNSVLIGWSLVLISTLLFVPLMLLSPMPVLTWALLFPLLVGVGLDLVALLLHVEALRHSDISLTMPLLALSPLFLMLSSFLVNQELPSLSGMIGILIIIVGVYVLNAKDIQHFLTPILRIFRNRGTRNMLIVAIIWGINGAISKYALLQTNAFYVAGVSGLILLSILTPIAFFRNRKQFLSCIQYKHLKLLLPMGIFDAVSILTQLYSQTLTLSAFAISVKRTSVIFAAIMAWYFFKEDIKHRLIPICLILTGVVMIALA